MGPEAAVIASLAGTVGSAALQSRAAEKQAKRQQELADQMNSYRLMKAREGEAATTKFLDTEAPEQRAVEMSATQGALASNLEKSVGAQQAFETPQNFAGKVSEGYGQRVASNEAATSDRLKRSIQQLAAIGAPGQRDLTRSLRLGEAAGGVGSANSAAGNVSNSYLTGINNTGADPFLMLASQLAAGAGRGVALKKGGVPSNQWGQSTDPFSYDQVFTP